MNKDPRSTGPDVVVVGAARSGTTFLAAQLERPPAHRRAGRQGAELLQPATSTRVRPGTTTCSLRARRDIARLDASVSYTFPHFPDALAALAKASPQRAGRLCRA